MIVYYYQVRKVFGKRRHIRIAIIKVTEKKLLNDFLHHMSYLREDLLFL